MGMKTEKFREVLERITHHGGILLKGIVRAVYGTLVSLAVVLAVYGFIETKSETGYVAVSDFVCACALLAIALINVYVIGGKKGWKK